MASPFLPPQLSTNTLDSRKAVVSAYVVDDVTGTILPGVTIKWDAGTIPGGIKTDAPFYSTTNALGWSYVVLESIHGNLTFTPYIPGYTITYGTATTGPQTSGAWPQIYLPLRAIRSTYPAPLVHVSGTIGPTSHQTGEWTNSPFILVQPIFEKGDYSYSTMVPIPDEGTDNVPPVTTGQGVHLRYLWGGYPWTQDDVVASGIPYEYPSGILAFNMEDFAVKDTETRSDSKTTVGSHGPVAEILPSGSRYLAYMIEASGTTGAAYERFTRYEVKYDTADPPAPTINYTEARPLNVAVGFDQVTDTSSGRDVAYRIINSTSGKTSAWASGTYFTEGGLTANTSYTVGGQAKDAAGNIGSPGATSAIITLTTQLVESDLQVTPAVDVTTGDRCLLKATPIPNGTTGSSGYRFRRWNSSNADVSTTPTVDSGWIQSSDWMDIGITPGERYTWALTVRNQSGTESNTIRVLTSAPSPVADPSPPPPQEDMPRLGDIILQAEESPVYRKAVRLDSIKLVRTRYNESGIYIRKPVFVNKPIYQITLSVNATIPASYPEGDWITYAIRLNNTENEIPIIPLEKASYTTIVVNSLLSSQERTLAEQAGWVFVDMSTEPSSIAVVIRLSRPQNAPFSSPVVNSYTLYIKPRSTLYNQATERGPSPRA